jgi:dTDP-6-deoxy-L-talose 4-dehydrogenase (NAD+)
LQEDAFTDPLNYYAIAKDTLRRVVALRCSARGVQWCWLRVFYPYGVGQNQSSLLPSLQRAIDEGQPLFAMSSGRQLRDFVSVEDVAKQLLILATAKCATGIYNGGSGHPRSVLELAEELVSSNNSSIKLDRGAYPDRSDEPLAFWAQMNKLKALQPHHPSQS